MAYFSNDKLFLGAVPNRPNFIDFNVISTEESTIANTSYYLLINGVVNTIPSVYLCPGAIYVLRVHLAGFNSLIEKFVGISNGFAFPLVDREEVSRMAMLIASDMFNVKSGSFFTGHFGGVLSYRYMFKRNSNWGDVGLGQPIPTVLSDCSACPCAEGMNCTSGLCFGRPNVPCPNPSVCGSLGGRCGGICADPNTECQNVAGLYGCAYKSNYDGVMVALSVIGFVFLILLVFGLAWYASRLIKKTELNKEEVEYIPPPSFAIESRVI